MTADLSKREFARLLWRLADLVRAGESRRSFRAKAYRTAVWALDDLPGLDVDDDQLLATPGIGPGVTALIKEYRSTGQINQLIPLEKAHPRDAPRMRRLPRMTPRILHDLKGLGIETTADLLQAIESGTAGTVRGAGTQTLDLWRRILGLPPGPGFFPSHEAWMMASQLASHIADHTNAEVHVAGSVRRVQEWANCLDLVAITENVEYVTSFLAGTAVLSSHSQESKGLHVAATHSGLSAQIHLAPHRAAGTALFIATGPPEHLIQVNERTDQPSEEEVYRSAGLAWIPPPARELPLEQAAEVIRIEDLKGDLHVHGADSPDGGMSLETILHLATAKGYQYVLITDHTKGLHFGGLTGPEIEDQGRAIERLRPEFPEITIFHGAELNIMKDGALDLDDDALEPLDFAVAGVHSYFGLDRDAQTKRITSALEHPIVRILAHPFGRRIGVRPAIDLDMDAVIDVAKAQGVALETNGHRDRLDLPPAWIAVAADRGAFLAANSDAHRVHEMDNIANAVATLQRSGVTPGRVINSFEVDDLSEWVSRGRPPGESLMGGEGGI